MEVIAGHDLEKAILIFRRACGPILKEVKDRRGYLKPSVQRKIKHHRALVRLKKATKKGEAKND